MSEEVQNAASAQSFCQNCKEAVINICHLTSNASYHFIIALQPTLFGFTSRHM